MPNFTLHYKSFEEMYNTILDGNEIEFELNEKKYFLLPYYESNCVLGVAFGEFETKKPMVCLSIKELYNIRIDDMVLGEIIEKTEILWTNF